MERVPLSLVISLVLMALGWLVPNHYLPWLAFHSELAAATGFALLTFTTMGGGAALVAWPRLALLALALAAIPPVQAAAGLIYFWGDAWIASLYLLGFALALVVGHRLALRHEPNIVLPTLWLAVLAGAILSVGVALCQWLGLLLGLWGAEMPFGGRPYANLAQPNQLSTLLALGLVAGLALAHQRLIGPLSLSLVLSLLLFGIVMTGSRSGWLQVGILSMWLFTMHGRSRLATPRVTALLMPAVLMAAMWAWPRMSEALYLAAGRSAVDQAQVGTRPIHWASMVDAIMREPLVGYGWNQVSVAQARVATAYPASTEMIEHSHNLFLDLLVWNGIPLGLVIFAALLWWLVRRVRTCGDGQVAWLLAAIGVVGAHAMLEFPLDYAYFLLPVGLMMGLAQALSSANEAYAMRRAVSMVPALAALILVVWTTLEYFPLEEANRVLRFQAAGIQGPRHPPPPPRPPILLTQQRAMTEFAAARARPGLTSGELDDMRRVAQRFGYPPVLLRFAIAAGLNGHPKEAADALSRLCRTHPIQRCKEGRAAWEDAARNQYPELQPIAFPPIPEIGAPPK